MYARIADFVLRHSKLVVIGFLIAAALMSTNILRLSFDFTPQQLFRSNSDSTEYREVFAERFGREDNLVFVLIDTEDVFTPTNLAYLRDATLAIRGLDFVETAESVATMDIPRAGDQPGVMSTKPIVPSEGVVTPTMAEALRELVKNEPLVRGGLVNEKGTVTGLLVWLPHHTQDIRELDEGIDRIRETLEDIGPPDGMKLRFGGVAFLRTEVVDSLKMQQMTFIPGTALAYLLVLLFLFRRPSGVLAPMGVVSIASLMTITLLVVTNRSINIINNVLPTLIFIIGVSDSIHMLVRDAEETEGGADRATSIREMIRHTGAACLLTSTTTAVGFFSLMAADTEILQDFGWEAGAGVMFAYAVTLFFLPAMLVHLRPVERKAAGSSENGIIERWLQAVGERVLDYPKTFIAISLTIAGIGVWFGSSVVIDTTLLEVYDEDHPSYATMQSIQDELGGVLPVEISLEATERDHFKDPAIFAKMHEIQRFAEQDKVVLRSQSIVDFHQAARVALLGDPNEREVMPDSREQIEQLQVVVAGPPDAKRGVNRYVTSDFRHARILLRVRDAGAREQLRLGNKLHERLAKVFPKETGVTYQITGDAYVASHALDGFIRDLFYSLLLAMVIIFFMMTIVFRSLTIGLVAALPNTVPLILTFGYMGLAGIDLNTTTVVIFAISLGLAVDDTIHFLARFREEQGTAVDTRTALLGAYRGAGRAIMITSVMLLIGLVVLFFSDFMPTQQFGKLTGITIFGALLGDLLLLPPILLLVYRRKDRRASALGEEE